MRRPSFVLRLLAGLVAAWMLGWLFSELSEELSGTLLGSIERSLMELVAADRDRESVAFMLAISSLGSALFFLFFSVGLAYLFLKRGRPLSAAMILIVTAGAGALSVGLKLVYNRPRPDVSPVLDLVSASFPSGHSLASVAIYGIVAYLLSLQVRWYWKPFVWTTYLLLALLICISRVYLGVHWPTDVIGGILAGGVWLVTCVLAYEVLLHVCRLRGVAGLTERDGRCL